MRLLTRYLVIGVARRTVFTLFVLLAVYTIFDLVELAALLERPLKDLAEIYFYKIPTITSQMLPLAVAVGCALTVSTLRTHGEWHAFNALGIPSRKIALTMAFVPLISTIFSMWILFQVAPKSLAAIETINPKTMPSNSTQWIRFGSWLLEVTPKKVDQAILLPSKRHAVERFQHIGTSWKHWEKNSGWTMSDAPPIPSTPTHVWSAPTRLGTFEGATYPYSSLLEQIDHQQKMGLSTASLEAEKGLRWVLVFATMWIPLSTLLTILRRNHEKAAHVTGDALFTTVTFWLLTALFWNGVQIGVWRGNWLILGVPLLHAIFVGLCLVAVPRTAKKTAI